MNSRLLHEYKRNNSIEYNNSNDNTLLNSRERSVGQVYEIFNNLSVTILTANINISFGCLSFHV